MSDRWDEEFARDRARAEGFAHHVTQAAAAGPPRYRVASWNEIKQWAADQGLDFDGHIAPVNKRRHELGKLPFALSRGAITAGVRRL